MGTRKQKNTEGKTERKVKGKGFGLRLSFAIILTFCAAWFFFGVRLLGVAELKIFNLVSLVFLILAVFQYIAAFAGKKKKWADIISIVIGSIFLVYCGLGALALVGGIKGYKQLKATEPKPIDEVAQTPQAAQAKTARTETSEAEFEKRQINRSDFKLDLYDASIDEKTWKQFKKTASQEELAVIAIGAKYRVAHSRIKNILFAIGIVLSIALFWPTGGFSLIGYPVFAFLSTKSIRYEDTLNQAYKKLNKENKAFVDGYFNCGIGWTILDIIIKFCVFWLTIPYQAILLFIGTFAPNFVISKNGILVSIPNGYDVGDLGTVGAYYSSFGFIDEALANQSKTEQPAQSGSPADDYYKKDAYTYTDGYGYEQTVYSGDGKDFYDVGGHYVGSSDENGGKFKKEE